MSGRVIPVDTCRTCPSRDHKGGFGPVAYVPVCDRANRRELPHEIRASTGPAGVPRIVADPTYKIPQWCPLPKAEAATCKGGLQDRADALAAAFCLLDTFAGEGLGPVYGNGTEQHADEVVLELSERLGFDLSPGWWRELANELLGNDPDEATGCADDNLPGSADDYRAALKEEEDLIRYGLREEDLP